MALSVDHTTYVISVPKADLTLIQTNPIEVRELNLNAFHLELREWEATEAGVPEPKTHTHNTEVTLGGLTFARVIEILSPYTITFEDGQYAVNLVGANSNVGDRINVNQVSVRSQNSAGLISSPAIEFASFNGGVIIDVNSGISGTVFPKGTEQAPVNNISDALLIAEYRGFSKLYLWSDIDIDGSFDLSNFFLQGRSHIGTDVEVETDADVIGVTISECNVFGILDGGTDIQKCIVGDVLFFNGHIHDCSLTGTITLDGNEDAYIVNTTQLDIDIAPVINMGGSGQDLVMINWVGILYIDNLTGANKVGIGMNGGEIRLDTASVTSGTIQVSGIGRLTDELGNELVSGTWNGGVTIINELLSPEHIAQHNWNYTLP